ncbi:YcnI family protein [Paenibacillus tarimensis]
MKKYFIAITAMMASLLFASVASAHVTVRPTEVKQGSYEVFNVRVPSETKGTNTVKVEVKIPGGVNISRVEPKQGWTYELERAADERIAGVTWTAEGEGLAVTEFTEFRISGKVADDAAELSWKAYQTYADGSIVEWVGAPDSDKPASVTNVLAGTGESDGHGHGNGAAATAGETAAADTASADAAGSGTPVTMGLSIAALALSVIALVLAFRRTRK